MGFRHIERTPYQLHSRAVTPARPPRAARVSGARSRRGSRSPHFMVSYPCRVEAHPLAAPGQLRAIAIGLEQPARAAHALRRKQPPGLAARQHRRARVVRQGQGSGSESPALGVMVFCSARRTHTALQAVSAVSAEVDRPLLNKRICRISGKQAGLSEEAAGAEVCSSEQQPPEPPGLGLATLQLYVLSTCLLAVISACVRVKAQDTALLVSAPTKRRPVNSPSVGFDQPTCAATQVPAHMNSALAANA